MPSGERSFTLLLSTGWSFYNYIVSLQPKRVIFNPETENPELEFSIIPSMVNIRRNIEKQRLEELSQSFQITPPIRNLVQMQESISLKKPMFLFHEKSEGRKDYENLWNSLNL